VGVLGHTRRRDFFSTVLYRRVAEQLLGAQAFAIAGQGRSETVFIQGSRLVRAERRKGVVYRQPPRPDGIDLMDRQHFFADGLDQRICKLAFN